ncbi:MAG: hypothetical protein FWC20_09095 [Oscillospiraceae bacterium]|nr:hypothetical protein [Oscillospiraceae bacterium]
MQDLILSVDALPDTLHKRIGSEKVRVHEENGAIILTPVPKSESTILWGLLQGNKFTTEQYLAQKKQDKELEA